jgi:hypothetical protein
MPSKHQPNRPTLGLEGAEAHQAIDAVARLVEELQAGWDQHDADLSNRHFAADIMWGSPFGATVQGYGDLHAIHVRLKQQGRGGPSSRFEIVRVLVPAPGGGRRAGPTRSARPRRGAYKAIRQHLRFVLRDGALRARASRWRLVARCRTEHAYPFRGVAEGEMSEGSHLRTVQRIGEG